MSIYKRGNLWWANFTVNGKRIQTSTGCTGKKEALEWEKQYIANFDGENNAKIALEKVKIALVAKNVTFEKAWDKFCQYPRSTTPSKKLLSQYKAMIFDFYAFLEKPSIVLSEVTEQDARNYIQFIRQNGRFSGFSYNRNGKNVQVKKTHFLSARTINYYIGTLRLFFSVMQNLKYVLENPFDAIEKIPSNAISREVFTDDDIGLLLAQRQHILYPIIVIGLHTGLRLGDMVRLETKHIDWTQKFIRINQHKTQQTVDIPMLPPVIEVIRSAMAKHKTGPLFSDLLEIYLRQSDVLSVQFKTLLTNIGIENTTISVPGRTRKQSVKDIHSLRHTFASISGTYRIPLHIVQAILGHMTPAMTRHYMAHASDADKTKFMAAFPDLSRQYAPKQPLNQRIQRLLDRTNIKNFETTKRRINRILANSM